MFVSLAAEFILLLFEHGDLNPTLFSDLYSSFIAGIGMAGYTHAGIYGQDPFQTLGCFWRTVGDDDLSGVQAVADAHAAAVMEADPGRAAGSVDQRIKNGPIGDGVGAIFHAFRFAIGAGHGAAVKVITADYDGRFHFAGSNKLVEFQTCLGALAITQPTYACRQVLEIRYPVGPFLSSGPNVHLRGRAPG